ncbi:transcriptional regulator [Bisbaumannia pacifica]|uniref:Transcriptional regulator n=1 Tax=Bisbaumannia pacifica TaxID=77098 RepID=A0A510X4Q6_9GAMM|nr:helix-turn-helix domain-containing protein [Halomonas pacifica]GEK46418.1 transcriptional regulator [Halomonas pacifica]
MKTIRALRRGLEVIDCLAASAEPLGLAELYRATGIDKSTLLRLLATLIEQGWACRGLGDGRYRLTATPVTLGPASAEVSWLSLVGPYLVELHDGLGWPSDLALVDEASLRIIETSRPLSRRIRHREVLGFRPGPLRSALGRAWLAGSEERRRQTLLRRLASGPGEAAWLARDKDYLARLTQEFDALGYARRDPAERLMVSAEEPGYAAIALPIRRGGEVCACLSVVFVPGEAEEAQLAQGLRHVITALETPATPGV